MSAAVRTSMHHTPLDDLRAASEEKRSKSLYHLSLIFSLAVGGKLLVSQHIIRPATCPHTCTHAHKHTHMHLQNKQSVTQHNWEQCQAEDSSCILHESDSCDCVCVGLWLLYLPTAQPSQTWYIARIIYVLWPCWHSTGSYRSKHDFTNLKRSHFCWREPFTYSEL